NEYSFPFIPIDEQEKVTEFLKIETDTWPIKGFRNYIQLQKDLEATLEIVRQGYRDKIRAAYNEQFDYLESVAKEQGVPLTVLSDRENTIAAKTAPDNILILDGNTNTDKFYEDQVEKIINYVNAHKPQPETKVAESKHNYIKQVTLETKTKEPLKDEKDIDNYLAGLKEQLTKLLTSNGSIMIIK
ncbi:MAG: BREX system P-loop protein BrxC, partial [Bacteroidaceae bacterium]|nr:BREX system P-loop protein BrxC [Bacteroidaceae bacterium]